MNQATIKMLLSRLITQLESDYVERGGARRRELADRLAQAAWSGLVMLMRHSFAESNEMLLEEVGLFRKGEEGWTFIPADTMLEAESLRMPTEAALVTHARQVLFHLDTAAGLLRGMPHDVELPTQFSDKQEWLYRAVFESESSPRRLSSEVERMSHTVARLAAGLEEDEDEAREVPANGAAFAPEASTPVMQIPVDALELTVRAYNALKNLEVRTVGDIVSQSPQRLRAMLGKRTMSDVEEALRPYGVEPQGHVWTMYATHTMRARPILDEDEAVDARVETPLPPAFAPVVTGSVTMGRADEWPDVESAEAAADGE